MLHILSFPAEWQGAGSGAGFLERAAIRAQDEVCFVSPLPFPAHVLMYLTLAPLRPQVLRFCLNAVPQAKVQNPSNIWQCELTASHWPLPFSSISAPNPWLPSINPFTCHKKNPLGCHLNLFLQFASWVSGNQLHLWMALCSFYLVSIHRWFPESSYGGAFWISSRGSAKCSPR